MAIDVDGGVLWLVSFVVCVLLVVAISAVSWFSWRSGVLQRSAGWLWKWQQAEGQYHG